jgi:excisionase family DNA binding protein
MFTIKQAATRMGVSDDTVRGLCKGKRLRHIRVGLGRGKIVIPDDAIAEYLAAHTVGVEAAAAPSPQKQRPVTLKHLRLPS